MSRILVIDDNDLVSVMLREHLTHEGYEVTLAPDANKGYAAAIEFRPDLILLDVQLPDVVGFDLIRIFKNRDDLAHIPIIMITGTAHTSQEKVRGFKLGADDYILKPFDMPELLERVAAILRRSERKAVPSALPHIDGANTVSPEPVRQPPLSLLRAVEVLMLTPQDYPFKASYPAASMAFLMTTLALGFVGLAAAAGPAIKPAVFAVALLLSWVVLVSALVMSASVMGLNLTWKDGGRLLSLAMTPLILKLAGGVTCSLWTSLSPFYFNAGPAVFFKSVPWGMERFDLFELWSAWLLWWLLRGRPSSSVKRAMILCLIVWATAIAMVVAIQKVGG